uniref:Uncharacterized protein n=1 Tax=Anguilla anguilla TaxID=7936 RepID=A0A0E9QIF6_ANGAN
MYFFFFLSSLAKSIFRKFLKRNPIFQRGID